MEALEQKAGSEDTEDEQWDKYEATSAVRNDDQPDEADTVVPKDEAQGSSEGAVGDIVSEAADSGIGDRDTSSAMEVDGDTSGMTSGGAGFDDNEAELAEARKNDDGDEAAASGAFSTASGAQFAGACAADRSEEERGVGSAGAIGEPVPNGSVEPQPADEMEDKMDDDVNDLASFVASMETEKYVGEGGVNGDEEEAEAPAKASPSPVPPADENDDAKDLASFVASMETGESVGGGGVNGDEEEAEAPAEVSPSPVPPADENDDVKDLASFVASMETGESVGGGGVDGDEEKVKAPAEVSPSPGPPADENDDVKDLASFVASMDTGESVGGGDVKEDGDGAAKGDAGSSEVVAAAAPDAAAPDVAAAAVVYCSKASSSDGDGGLPPTEAAAAAPAVASLAAGGVPKPFTPTVIQPNTLRAPSNSQDTYAYEEEQERLAMLKSLHRPMRRWFNEDLALRERHGSFPMFWQDLASWPPTRELKRQYLVAIERKENPQATAEADGADSAPVPDEAMPDVAGPSASSDDARAATSLAAASASSANGESMSEKNAGSSSGVTAAGVAENGDGKADEAGKKKRKKRWGDAARKNRFSNKDDDEEMVGGGGGGEGSGAEGPPPSKARKSRWSSETEAAESTPAASVGAPAAVGGSGGVIPGMPVNLSQEQIQETLVLQVRLTQANEKLATVDQDAVVRSQDPDRSPSPPPRYDSNGVRTNPRNVRMREALNRERSERSRL